MCSPRIVICSCCAGEGKIYVGQFEDERYICDCELCEGTGGELIIAARVTLDDLIELEQLLKESNQ